MKFKKIAAAVLAATPATVKLFSLFSVTANAAYTLTEGDYKYTVNDDGETVTITRYTGSDVEVDILGTLGGKTVTKIGENAFEYCGLTSVVIPDGVTSIGSYAFIGCDYLESVMISSSVTNIIRNPFGGCDSLKEIYVDANNELFSSVDGVLFNKHQTKLICYPAGKDTSYDIPSGVTEIGELAFHWCEKLTSVTMLDSVTTINNSAFYGCTSLKNVTIPDKVTTIVESAFAGCHALGSVTIPNSVTTIEEDAFSTCSSIQTVNYGGTKTEWEAIVINADNFYLTRAEIICTDGIINEREPDTSEPTSSDTSEPTTSDTSEPTTSDTSEPTTSDTSEPTSSDTSEPTTSNTSEPTTSNTSEPTTSEPTDPDLFIKENEVSTEIEVPTEAEKIPESDRITSITINPAFNMKNKNDNNVELDLSKITIKAEAIYDKVGLKRAEEALGKTIKGNKHYNLLDLTLLYNGEDFSNGYEGLVKVIIPLPKGHRDKNFSCFRLTEVNGKMVKEVIPGEQTEDSYIIYLEHFSLYALVADANPDDGEKQPEKSKDPAESAPVTPGDTDNNTGNNSGSNSGNDQANTGIALAIAPIALAASVVIVASKKKK